MDITDYTRQFTKVQENDKRRYIKRNPETKGQ